MESSFPFLNVDQVTALLKNDAIFSDSQLIRKRCIKAITKQAENPVSVIEEIVQSLPEGDNFRMYCQASIERIRADVKEPPTRRRNRKTLTKLRPAIFKKRSD